VQKKNGEIAHAPIVSRSQNLKKRPRILQFATHMYRRPYISQDGHFQTEAPGSLNDGGADDDTRYCVVSLNVIGHGEMRLGLDLAEATLCACG
jgi:hypothetical protein